VTADSTPTESADPQDKAQFDPLAGGLSAIARRYEELEKQNTLTLFIPGYEGLMQVRYHLLPPAQMDRIADQRRDIKGTGISGEWELEAQTLVDLCDVVLLRDPETDEYIELRDDNGPIRFESRFAEVLGRTGVKVNGARNREIVLDFFSPKTKPDDPSSPRRFPTAMDRHVTAIFAWYRGERDKIDRTLLGE
jgi:hypothetical protein